MTTATVDTRERGGTTTLRDRAIDAVREAAHCSHEARLLKSVATDTLEEGVHAAKRMIVFARRRGVEEVEDLRDAVAYRVKHHPFQAVGGAFGIGLVCGLAIFWIGGRLGGGSD